MVIGQKFGNCLDGYPLFELLHGQGVEYLGLYTSLTLNLKVVDRFMRESAMRTSRSSCLDAGSMVIGQKFDNCLDGYPLCQLQAITSRLKGRIVWLLI